jgi:cell division protein FtsB
MSSEPETIYERVAKLEDEVALLRSEVDILKRDVNDKGRTKLEDEVALLRSEVDILKGALRNKIARHEISMIKKGQNINSIID